jgi:hypothetical protein
MMYRLIMVKCSIDTTLYQLVQRIDRSFSEIYSRDAEEADRSEGKGEARSSDSKTAKAPQLLVNNGSYIHYPYLVYLL